MNFVRKRQKFYDQRNIRLLYTFLVYVVKISILCEAKAAVSSGFGGSLHNIGTPNYKYFLFSAALFLNISIFYLDLISRFENIGIMPI